MQQDCFLFKNSIIIQILWLLTLVTIPLLSIFGRPVQRFLKENLSHNQITIILGLVLLVLSFKAIYWLIRRHSYRRVWHLLWFVPLFIIAPYFMPVVEERVHFIVFGCFGFLSMLIFPPRTAIALCISISVLDEGLQWYLPDRVGDWFDVSINMLASVAGAIFSFIIWKQKC